MIRSINKLRSFGIYEDHNNVDCDEFVKFNLIYGWNGSGKSTLTKLFRCIEKKDLQYCGYQSPEFEICYDDADQIKRLNEKNINKSPLKLFAFNNDFIKENIDWDNSVSSILLIDKNKIEDRKALDELKSQYNIVKLDLKNRVDRKLSLEKSMQDFLTKAARNIKTNLQIINTQDSRYLNYNRTSLAKLLNREEDRLYSNDSLLDDDELSGLTRAALPIEMPVVNVYLQRLDIMSFADAHEKIKGVLQKTVASDVIQSLKDNPTLHSWVEQGMLLHNELGGNECMFCGSELHAQRMLKLESHFSNAFRGFKMEISSAFKYCSEIPHLNLPPKDSLFPEFQREYTRLVDAIKESKAVIDKLLEIWRDVLKIKHENPFESSLSINAIPLNLLIKYDSIIFDIQAVIAKHNNKSQNFTEEMVKIKNKLEIHYATREFIDFEYKKKEVDKNELEEAISKLVKKESDLKGNIYRLENSLSDESIAAKAFNEELHKFLGRGEISLCFDKVKKGYRIERNGSTNHARNLSEGEKTAIAFVYFAIKVGEDDNDITQSIVVIDDPVSSFDSNHLFHSYAFLKKIFEPSKQLFVLTHSFSYFKLIRDWILKKNKKDKIKSRVYTVETYFDGVRKSRVINASGHLTNYNSEYHYLYSRLKHFKEKMHLDLDEVYLCANLSRKLLETFLSFKFPKKRDNFRALVDDSVKNIEGVNLDEVEKIYRFINKYSHNQEIDMGDNTDNLLGESPLIIKSLFSMIQKIDAVHFSEMEALTA
ncbi:TPA: AAA family ATPase [Citrobacter freundii]|nr:AAA family ATPase [Citrobacter freundii]HBN5499945.1 AAA family ATPase [Citrobacter freundii]HBU9124944.1 AAA family ATPase [Citrobacter freundii]